jgi:nitrogen-specific signal transduction histidine kinase
MSTHSRSLLDFLDAPVLVGDPDGRTVYANPAFEDAFHRSPESIRGHALAELFEGGGREAMLRAVAEVCGGSGPIRFRLRESQVGYSALASPIEADQGRVGVLILLTEEQHAAELGAVSRRDLEEPVDELGRCLEALGRELRDDDRFATLLEDAGRALDWLRKRSEGGRAAPIRSR